MARKRHHGSAQALETIRKALQGLSELLDSADGAEDTTKFFGLLEEAHGAAAELTDAIAEVCHPEPAE